MSVSVVLLGIDGAGKTTQTNLLAERLRAEGVPADTYDRSAGVDIERHSPDERLALAAGAVERIGAAQRAAAEKRAVWVSDRYADCHLAVDALTTTPCPERLGQVLAPLPRPTLVVWLEIEPMAAQERIRLRGYDEESAAYLAALREAYLGLATASDYRHVAADGPPDEVHHLIWQELAAVAPYGCDA